MPQSNRRLTRAIRERRQYTGEPYTAARDGVLATLTLPETEQKAHAFRAAVERRMAYAGEDAERATTAVEEIQDLVECNGWTFEQAQTEYDEPRNQIMCQTCGWTYGMVCPECPGCGCYNGRCTGWRHHEFMTDEERRERNECPECGGDMRNHYECRCYDDED